VIGKSIRRFSSGGTPVIAGGLIETKQELTDALGSGATAVSTGRKELWYL
jgi:glycerol uptake operon antiterminator